MSRSVSILKERSKSWLFESAFPLWSSSGLNDLGGFREDLAMDGTPHTIATTRVRVQARQVFCFALAARMGWQDGGSLCRQGAHYLLKYGVDPRSGLPGMVIEHGHGLVDNLIDLYDVAFVLLAFSSAYAVTKDPEIQQALFSLLDALETRLCRPPAEGGYKESSNPAGLREQNPHMHLFEALLAAAAATGRNEILGRAHRVARFVEEVFIRQPGQLQELAGAGVPSLENRLEAGHHFEWVWLLLQEERLTGRPLSGHVQALFDTGRGLSRPDGRIPLSHALDGSLNSDVLRAWTLTEAIKACLALGRKRKRVEETREQVVTSLALLFEDHLLENGGWIDQRNAAGATLSTAMPASTFYHVVFALYELEFGESAPVFAQL